MPTSEQETFFQLLKLLLQKKGAWKVVSALTALPIIVGAVVALVTYNFAAINYLNKVNFAAANAPVLARAVAAQNVNIAAVRSAVTEIHDTLRKDGYYLRAIPELIPIPEVTQ